MPDKDTRSNIDHLTDLYDLIPTTIAEEYDVATYYRQANELISASNFPDICSGKECPPMKPWNASDFPELPSWIDDHPQVFDLIRTGTIQEDCLRPLGPIKSSNIIPIESFPFYMIEYLKYRIRYNFGRTVDDEAKLVDLSTVLQVIKHLKETSLIRNIMSLATEYILHKILQYELKGDVMTAQLYRGITQSFDILAEFQRDPIWRSMLFEIGAHRLSINEYFHQPFDLDSTFWSRMGDIINWCLLTTFNNPIHEARIWDDWFKMHFELWDEPYHSPHYWELRNQLKNYSEQHDGIVKFFDLSIQGLKIFRNH